MLGVIAEMRKIIIISIIAITFIGCQTDLELAKIIDQNSPLIRTIMSESSLMSDIRIDTILVNSDTWNELLNFASENTSDWKSTPASYNSDYFIRQDNFQLMGWNNGTSVVINYMDSNGQSNQLTKIIEAGELNFLME